MRRARRVSAFRCARQRSDMFSTKKRSDDSLPLNGDEGIRTLDPLLARQVLSQLSYTPKCLLGKKIHTLKTAHTNLNK